MSGGKIVFTFFFPAFLSKLANRPYRLGSSLPKTPRAAAKNHFLPAKAGLYALDVPALAGLFLVSCEIHSWHHCRAALMRRQLAISCCLTRWLVQVPELRLLWPPQPKLHIHIAFLQRRRQSHRVEIRRQLSVVLQQRR